MAAEDSTKQCSQCGEQKQIGDYYRASYGLYAHCKACHSRYMREHYQRNKRSYRERSPRWRELNPEKARKFHLDQYYKNRAAKRKYNDEWYKRNPHISNEKNARRYAAKVKATPAWASREKIKEIYKLACERGMEVDHIVPLRSRRVCGLHCEFNLQLLTEEENNKKGNRVWPDMP